MYGGVPPTGVVVKSTDVPLNCIPFGVLANPASVGFELIVAVVVTASLSHPKALVLVT